MDYLSDIEKEKIIAFNSDTIMFEAVKKVLLASIYENGVLKRGEKTDPMRNAAFSLVAMTGQGIVSNEELGEDLRGMFEGAKMLELGMRELAKIIREDKTQDDAVNEAI